jgi:hypothetical protein
MFVLYHPFQYGALLLEVILPGGEHIDTWFAIARRLECGIERLEEFLPVTDRDGTKSRTNGAFLGSKANA